MNAGALFDAGGSGTLAGTVLLGLSLAGNVVLIVALARRKKTAR